MPNFSEIPWIAEHIKLYKTDPEKAHMWDSSELGGPGVLPTLLLTTKGRKSGELRSVPLIYGKVGHGYVVIASKGGMPTHPAWYLNLQDEEDCEIMVGPEKITVRARDAKFDERARHWTMMANLYPPYVDYQKATDREIPVVVFDPI